MKNWLQTIQDIAQDIFQELGSGFSEAIYQKAFEVALRERQIEYEEQRKVPIFFHGYFVGEAIPDLIVRDNGQAVVVVELKAVQTVGDKEVRQVKKYMETLKIPLGAVVNFPTSTASDRPQIISVNLEC
ncbi:GxxExxY protein [Thermosynechococcus sp.]|uniref:GxxExxY protein n=1 Tax=Thermosynechococcus sp. TaxID=2814275 RepID=UPI00391D25AB